MKSEAMLMDCMDFMRGTPTGYFDLAVCDPPYGIKRDGGFGGFGGFGKPIARKKYKAGWDENTPDKIYFDELLRISKNVIIWGGQFFTDKLPVCGHWIFWDKLNTMPTFGDGELAYTNYDRNSVKRYVIQYNGLLGKEPNRIHATQKPVKLYGRIYKDYLPNGGRVFDSHAGSNSNRIAADMAGNIDYYSTEIDPDYFADAEKRWLNYKAQTKLIFTEPIKHEPLNLFQ